VKNLRTCVEAAVAAKTRGNGITGRVAASKPGVADRMEPGWKNLDVAW
jgi:hypothetical protein